ncbi:MAG: hypothetical protein KJZ62_08380 [Fimbriimonadaceae bacterium]|nr:hypothetical protein [Fimbriimonadaceae bacterium]MCL4285107.1 hypothetical protein [Fimbriimonadaceae bacterium]QOJ10514.1 MAG: hypothetical protein HRU74_00030 [Chthonomonadaceae bacterium]
MGSDNVSEGWEEPERRREVVCVLVGSAFDDSYVDRLYGMLHSFADVPFRLSVVTEKERKFQSPVEQFVVGRQPYYRDDMRPTQVKLELFRGGGWPFEEFLYIDLSSLLTKDLRSIWEFADTRSEPLVCVNDWKYDTINTCVMRVRRDAGLACIYEDYAVGKRYDVRFNGDQDYADASLKNADRLNLVSLFPTSDIVTYKNLLRQHRFAPRKARRAYESACIVKFGGSPKPHQVFEADYWWRHCLRRPHLVLRDRRYLVDDLQKVWTLGA